MSSYKLPKRTQSLLNEVGRDHWTIVQGGKHLKLYVHGQFCGVLPVQTKGDGDGRMKAELNTLSQIKRVLRAAMSQPNAFA